MGVMKRDTRSSYNGSYNRPSIFLDPFGGRSV